MSCEVCGPYESILLDMGSLVVVLVVVLVLLVDVLLSTSSCPLDDARVKDSSNFTSLAISAITVL
jgi:hypothetical protein